MKKMIKIAFVAAFAAIAGYGVYANQKTDVMSDLALANIEALADGGEGSGDCYGCAIYAIGIGLLFLQPYMSTARAAFYEDLKAELSSRNASEEV